MKHANFGAIQAIFLHYRGHSTSCHINERNILSEVSVGVFHLDLIIEYERKKGNCVKQNVSPSVIKVSSVCVFYVKHSYPIQLFLVDRL